MEIWSFHRNGTQRMNKKMYGLFAILAGLVSFIYILYTSVDKLKDLDLSDPFEVEIDDE